MCKAPQRVGWEYVFLCVCVSTCVCVYAYVGVYVYLCVSVCVQRGERGFLRGIK